jgi:hypothetical protein
MKINQQKTVQTDVKTLEIHCKVSDRFTYSLKDAQGETVFDQDDGYVPDFMPGYHYGDYIILNIDIENGQILNWKKLNASDIEEAIKRGE